MSRRSLRSPFYIHKAQTVPVEDGADAPALEQLFGHDHLHGLKKVQHELLLEGRPVLDLSMINPDLTPPRAVLDRLLEAVTKPAHHRYAVSRGIRRLREAFCVKYGKVFRVQLDPEREVCVCLGSKDATFQALRYLVAAGDAVVVGAPVYPGHLSAVALVGAEAVPWVYPTAPGAISETLEPLLQSSGARVLLLNLPANPTGVVVCSEWWQRLAEVCARHGIIVVNDFVYGEMCFSGEPAESALQIRSQGVRCVEVYSLSKAYNVPGWRVGALLGDVEVVRGVSRLKAHSDYGLFLPLQHAAAVALTAHEDVVRPTVVTYQRRVRLLTAGLRALGWQVEEPCAGACVWARYPEALALEVAPRGEQSCATGGRSVWVAERLLREAGVLVAPGLVFGPAYDGYVRFAAVVPEERIREVLSALGAVPAAA